LGLEIKGTLNVGGELTDDGLEFLVKPATKSMGIDAANGYHGQHSPRGLVDLCHAIKMHKFSGDVTGAIADGKSMDKEKRLGESHIHVDFAFNIMEAAAGRLKCRRGG
jgi:hypothetical protein